LKNSIFIENSSLLVQKVLSWEILNSSFKSGHWCQNKKKNFEDISCNSAVVHTITFYGTLIVTSSMILNP
jgi:hypothetical protein